MNTIWKFAIPIQDEVILEMPEGSEILCVQTQEDRAFANDDAGMIWAIVDSEAPTAKCKFRMFGTGNPFPADHVDLEYIGTFQLGSFVWHLFQDLSYES